VSDRTEVTGSPGYRAPRKGDVLGERYELVDALDGDALVSTFRGIDHESERPVLVRCTSLVILGEKEAWQVVDRLRTLIGVGGRLLSPLRDVDREGATVYTVEDWPRGTSLRAVLASRRGKGGKLEPREALPLLAGLVAAVASVPESWWHGDVRSERVWVDPDGLLLTGAFLISALPGDRVAEVLAIDDALRRCFAPEVAEGLGNRSSDRWGVGAVAWEALTGSPVQLGRIALPAGLAMLEPIFAQVLHPDPALRAPSLDAMVNALAELAELPAPRIEPDTVVVRPAVRRPDEAKAVVLDAGRTDHPPRLAGRPSARSSLAKPTAESEPPLAVADPPTERWTLGEGAEMPFDEMRTSPAMPSLRTDRDTAPHPTLGAEGEVRVAPRHVPTDPRRSGATLDPLPPLEPPPLGKTAPAWQSANENERSPISPSIGEDLDPRLVRAALGVTLEDSRPKRVPGPGRTPALESMDVPPPKAASVTQKLDVDELEFVELPVSNAPNTGSSGGGVQRPSGPSSPPTTAALLDASFRHASDSAGRPAPAQTLSASTPDARSRGAPAPVPPAGPSSAFTAAPRRRPARLPEPVPIPDDIKPIPQPRLDSDELELVQPGPVLFDASKPVSLAVAPAPKPGASTPVGGAPGTSAPTPPPAPVAAPAPTRAPRDAYQASWVGWLVLGVALLIAAAIVGAGFWYRAEMEREAQHEQMIQQRLRAIQSGRMLP
jgi:hypothetical protein